MGGKISGKSTKGLAMLAASDFLRPLLLDFLA